MEKYNSRTYSCWRQNGEIGCTKMVVDCEELFSGLFTGASLQQNQEEWNP